MNIAVLVKMVTLERTVKLVHTTVNNTFFTTEILLISDIVLEKFKMYGIFLFPVCIRNK